MKKVELIIFDLDGTLVDSSEDLIGAVNYTRRNLGLSLLSGEEIINFVGDGTDKLVERFLGPENSHLLTEATEIFLSHYDRHLLDNTVLYPGVREILNFYRDKKKIIITNKRYHFTKKITDALGITGYFRDIIAVGRTEYRKPDPKILVPLLAGYNIDPQDVVIIGDGINDIRLAINTGIKSCAALYGFTAKDVLFSLKPDYFCEQISDIRTLFY